MQSVKTYGIDLPINRTVCFTGHREIREADKGLSAHLDYVVETLIRGGFTNFCAGGARGFDALAAESVIRLSKKYPEVKLILFLPFENQYKNERGWTADEIKQYHKIRESADKVIHLQKQYTSGCYYKRNRCLVDVSGICISYQYKNSGGTAYTVNYARRKGRSIYNTMPNA